VKTDAPFRLRREDSTQRATFRTAEQWAEAIQSLNLSTLEAHATPLRNKQVDHATGAFSEGFAFFGGSDGERGL